MDRRLLYKSNVFAALLPILTGFGVSLQPLPSGKTLGLPLSLQLIETRESAESLKKEQAKPTTKQSATRLIGKVCVRHVFASGPSFHSAWTKELRKSALGRAEEGLQYLRKSARRFGHLVEFVSRTSYYRSSVSISGAVYGSANAWSEAAIEEVSEREIDDPKDCASKIAIFHVADTGTPHAITGISDTDPTMERAIVYANRVEAGRLYLQSPVVYAHEVLHLFGADDLYRPQVRQRWAQKKYPDDIMLGGLPLERSKIHAHTAFTIGWTDKDPGPLRAPFVSAGASHEDE